MPKLFYSLLFNKLSGRQETYFAQERTLILLLDLMLFLFLSNCKGVVLYDQSSASDSQSSCDC